MWTPGYIFAIVYNIVLATAFAYTVWIFVLDALPARDASMGTLANPVVGVLAAWLQLGEVPTRLSLTGMALIVLGLVVLTVSARVNRLTAREPHRIPDDEEARKSHGTRRKHWRNDAECGQRHENDVVGKRPEEVLRDRAHRRARDFQCVRDRARDLRPAGPRRPFPGQPRCRRPSRRRDRRVRARARR